MKRIIQVAVDCLCAAIPANVSFEKRLLKSAVFICITFLFVALVFTRSTKIALTELRKTFSRNALANKTSLEFQQV